jgi:hypothetical protein
MEEGMLLYHNQDGIFKDYRMKLMFSILLISWKTDSISLEILLKIKLLLS